MSQNDDFILESNVKRVQRFVLFSGMMILLLGVLFAAVIIIRNQREVNRAIDHAVRDAAELYYPGQKNIIIWTICTRGSDRKIPPPPAPSIQVYQVQFCRLGYSTRDIIDVDYIPGGGYWQKQIPKNHMMGTWSANMRDGEPVSGGVFAQTYPIGYH